jgi:16S rRNA (guanine1207-N2)-methyltransferase
VAARRGADVTLCDDSLVAVEATRRTLRLNGMSGVVIHGHDVTGQFDLVLLDAPRGREWVQYLLSVAAWALRPNGRLLLAGPNRGGIKGFIQDANELVGPCQVRRIQAAHRLAVCERVAVGGERPVIGSQTCEATVRGQSLRFVTQPGVFSHGGLDVGTRALIESMDIRPDETVLDLGCGCGVVGAAAAQRGARVVCVDSSAAAIQATRATLELNAVRNATVLASDCAAAVHDLRFDVVAANPPFHQGVGVEYAVAQQFVRDAARVLNERGRLYLVANRFIRYERVMAGLFTSVTTAYEDHRFRVLMAEGKGR